jgi:serine protease Do
MTRQASALVALTAVVSFLVGLVVAGGRPSPSADPYPVRGAAQSGTDLHVATLPAIGPAPATVGGVDFAAVAARLNASVVNVDSAARGTGERGRVFPPRYRRELGDDSTSPREGSGSGFVIDPAGFILTNYHVIEGADRLTVGTSDGRSFRAEVIGVDPVIDVALLKVDAPGPLVAAPLGKSSSLRVGEWVCAIGNPLGYVHSVTVGVVSFLGRKVLEPSLDALIQTDAAITFGNSGGPLINSRGEVVGMTTAISSLASNIGFAIPIDQIVDMLPQLHEHGRVIRGYVGVGLTPVTPALRQALHLEPVSGALVQDVGADTPAERGGLRNYDVILRIDGQAIASDEDVTRHISSRTPGSISQFVVWRDGAERELAIKLTERPGDGPRHRVLPGSVRPVSGPNLGPLGLAVRPFESATAARQGIPGAVQGVRISLVDAAGPARLARLSEGQIILEINRRPVPTMAAYAEVVASLRPGQPVALLIYDRQSGQLVVTIVPDPPS